MDPIKFDLKGLRSLGYAVLDITAHDYEADKDVYKFMVVQEHNEIYSTKIRELLGIEVTENDAQDMMEEIYKHKWIESEKAKHDIGMNTAAQDWYRRYFITWKKARNLQ